jgi:hypothetical protein
LRARRAASRERRAAEGVPGRPQITTLACGLIIAVIELSAGKGNVSDGQSFGVGCLAVAAMAFFVLLILFYWTKALKDIVARKLRKFMGDGTADKYNGSELDSESEIGSDSFRTNSFRVRPRLPAGVRRAGRPSRLLLAGASAV